MREHRFSIATSLATFVLLIVGSLVHGTGSSLACPDWPLCYGSLLPTMEGGVLYEHTHRIVATAVGTMTVVLAILLSLRKDRTLRALGLIATALVIFQGVLGGITVLYKLPRAISIAHLTTSMCFFSLTIFVTLKTAPRLPPATNEVRAMRRWIGVAWFTVLGQMVLGALVRHTASGLACFDVPLCDGALWPMDPRAQVQMVHRMGAVVTGVVVLAVATALFRKAEPKSLVRRLSVLPGLLVLVQIGLGLASVLSLLDLVTITTHLAVGAALLGSLVLLWGLIPAGASSETRRPVDNEQGRTSAVAVS